jgi:hypothetical protein
MPEPRNQREGMPFDEEIRFANVGPEANPAGGQAPAPSPSARQILEGWLAQMVEYEASDLILRASSRPCLRVAGSIRFLPGSVPGPEPLTEILKGVWGAEQMDEWSIAGAVDTAIQLDGLGRFRINAYTQMGEPAMVIRRIGSAAPDLTQLNLPHEDLAQLASRRRGLVLVTGVAGSGKSTTLAGMIEHMNRNVERHVITLEDPVELLYQERRCVISQREVGSDTPSFAQGLRHALRQSPDVILIGECEMRLPSRPPWKRQRPGTWSSPPYTRSTRPRPWTASWAFFPMQRAGRCARGWRRIWPGSWASGWSRPELAGRFRPMS